LLSCKYAISVIDKRSMAAVHVCLYENVPEQKDLDELKKELVTDPEFMFTEEQIENCIFHISEEKDIDGVRRYVRYQLGIS